MREREHAFDLLRFASALAVILLHVSASFINESVRMGTEVLVGAKDLFAVFLLNGMTRAAVPCFVMLAGAFALGDGRTRRCRYYYRKTLKGVWIPMIVASCLYVGYIMLCRVMERMSGSASHPIFMPIVSFLQGEPYYHLWYLYRMIGVYLMAPLVIRFREEFGQRTYERMVPVFMVLASLSEWMSPPVLQWDIGSSFCYLGYFMLGDVLRHRCCRKNLFRGLVCMAAGLVIVTLIGWLHYRQAITGTVGIPDWLTPMCPMDILGAVLIFAGFAMIPVKRSLGALPGLCYPIYLFHAGVWSVIRNRMPAIFLPEANAVFWTFAGTAVTFVITLVISVVYQRIWNALEDRFRISEWVCDLLIPLSEE